MKPFAQRLEELKTKYAHNQLTLIGKALMDKGVESMWEIDSRILGRGHKKWRKKAKRFSQEYIKPYAKQADIDPDSFDHTKLFKEAAKQGFLSAMVPKPIGSTGIDWGFKNLSFSTVLMAEEFAAVDGGLALKLLAPNLGVSSLWLSGDIRMIFRKAIPMYMGSTWFGKTKTMAYAITESSAGSDVEDELGGANARLGTSAKKVKGGFVLNGSKVFISNGAIADAVAVFTKLEGEGRESFTCFYIEKGTKGFSVGKHEKKLGQRASDASELILDNVFVPDEDVIGKVRGGWAINKSVLMQSRIPVGAMALGHARGAFENALAFTKKEYIGNKKMITFQEVQMELAQMVQELWSIRSFLWNTSNLTKIPLSMSASTKAYASDASYGICNRAMELMGDDGYLHNNNTERFWRDVRLTQIYEGTNQINRLGIVENHEETDFKR